jgi:hypothetical protein
MQSLGIGCFFDSTKSGYLEGCIMRYLIANVVSAALLISVIPQASATSLTGLYNTGAVVNANGTDANYTVSTNSATNLDESALNIATTPAYVSTFNLGSGVSGSGTSGTWLANTPGTSSWITPFSSGYGAVDPTKDGTYIYQTTFTISSNQKLSSATLSGQWAADNYASLYLNGNLISASTIANPRSSGQQDGLAYNTWTPINGVTSSDFKPGTNVLTFVVGNIAQTGGSTTGLRTEFTSNISPVAEPSEGLLLLSGVGLLGFVVARRKTA